MGFHVRSRGEAIRDFITSNQKNINITPKDVTDYISICVLILAEFMGHFTSMFLRFTISHQTSDHIIYGVNRKGKQLKLKSHIDL